MPNRNDQVIHPSFHSILDEGEDVVLLSNNRNEEAERGGRAGRDGGRCTRPIGQLFFDMRSSLL